METAWVLRIITKSKDFHEVMIEGLYQRAESAVKQALKYVDSLEEEWCEGMLSYEGVKIHADIRPRRTVTVTITEMVILQ